MKRIFTSRQAHPVPEHPAKTVATLSVEFYAEVPAQDIAKLHRQDTARARVSSRSKSNFAPRLVDRRAITKRTSSYTSY